MTRYRKTVIIDGEEYVPVSSADEYDFEYIYFTPKKEWDEIVEKYGDEIDLYEYYYAHNIGVRKYGELTEYIDEIIEELREDVDEI